ncbi:RIP metalloprotease RseP [Temperatibacter marinus]|uniref:Zinc metalloprotease n=1 Tax=Temperatibacter marinus TaxID=1456591 RepID=A0AA52EHY5_9PROT|nr:RIP metalloprotease RseP [Temperatibacter marinus]WND02381.1 RIP metalloprotease RseP [Temperatibacter marinus]
MEFDFGFIALSLLAFIGGFSLLVFVHEWGHYSVGRLFGVRVEVFSIGFGKEIYGYTAKSGTRWRLSAIPLGGYVKFFGDASAASNPGEHVEGLTDEEKKDCLHYKPLWQRALVVAAGPAVNLLLPVLIFAGFTYANGKVFVDADVSFVEEKSAADRAGFQVGDVIIAVNDREISNFTQVRTEILMQPGGPMDFTVQRGTQTILLKAIVDKRFMEDRFGNQYAKGYLGVRPSGTYKVVQYGLFGALAEGARSTGDQIGLMVRNIGQLILGLRSIKEVKGPVGMVQIMGDAASRSFLDWLSIVTVLSLSLGIMNLLPIPVLDGGHLLYYGLEAIKGGPINKKAQEAGFIIGFGLIILLMVVVTLNDLQSLVS